MNMNDKSNALTTEKPISAEGFAKSIKKELFLYFHTDLFCVNFCFFFLNIFRKEKTEMAGPLLLIVSFSIMAISTKRIASFSSTWWLGESF